MRSRDCRHGGFAFLFFRVLARGMAPEEEMKLHMFFLLFDAMILLAYPFIFIASKARRFFGFKR
jgi:hypothetical protein